MTKTHFLILLAFSTAFSSFDDEANDGDRNIENMASDAMYSALKEISTEMTNFKALSLLKGSWVTRCSNLAVEEDNFACYISMPQVWFHFAFAPDYDYFYSATVNIAGLLLRATFAFYKHGKVNLVRVDECTSDLVAVPADFPFRNAEEFMNAFKDHLNCCISMCLYSFYQSAQLSKSRADIVFESR